MTHILPDDLQSEIIEHIPPLPQSLVHASAVCRAWRRIVNDQGFLRRYRVRHGRPLTMGFFHNSDTIPRSFVHVGGFSSFSFERPGENEHRWKFMDCRHGRVLLFDESSRQDMRFLVWHPMTGYCHRKIVRQDSFFRLNFLKSNTNAALICAAGCDEDNHYMNCKPTSPFCIAVVSSDSRGRVSANVVSSLTGQWGPESMPVDLLPVGGQIRAEPCAIVNNTMYQPLYDYRVLAYDMGQRTLTSFERPRGGNVRLMKVDGGARLGLAAAQDLIIRLWVRDTDADGGWVLRKTIDLGELVTDLSMAPLPWTDSRFPVMPPVKIIGVAEEGDALFFWTMVGVFMMCPKSLEITKVHDTAEGMNIVYPYAAFYLLPAPQ
ncbi:uncharacterized protein LOC124704475 [Lolium rigidum]|uniref:uncharacterized protein LOC124704475 n=1 Tax=Lolium rigidum TaxID=89674 RepID=UPI001F5C3E26|nr:uncharacterized protein LOC124704475 [Lolium rigidum]